MPQFHYQALNADQQFVAGELDAPSVAQAIAQLEADGLIVQSIGYATSPASRMQTPVGSAASSSAAAIEETALVQHLAQVIERARPLLPALHAYAAELPAGRPRRQFLSLLDAVARGDAEQAAAGVRRAPAYWIALLCAATPSREPARLLDHFVSEAQRADELRRQWWWTMAYPVVILVLAAAVIVFLSVLPIPIFREMFTSFGLRLPGLTLLVLNVAAAVTSGRIVIAGVTVAIAAYLLYRAIALLPLALRNWVDDRIGTPFGRATAFAQFAQFLADLLEAELVPAAALRIAGFAVQSQRLRRATWRLAGDLDASRAIDTADYQRTITATALYALRGDLTPRSRVRLIRQLGTSSAERAARSLSWTRGVVEPLGILFVGLIVGIAVIALFLPLFSLIQGLSG